MILAPSVDVQDEDHRHIGMNLHRRAALSLLAGPRARVEITPGRAGMVAAYLPGAGVGLLLQVGPGGTETRPTRASRNAQ